MAATDVAVPLQLINDIAQRISEEEEKIATERFKSTFDHRYQNKEHLQDILSNFLQDNLVNAGDFFLIEECLGSIAKAKEIKQLIENFQQHHRKEIARLKEQESVRIYRKEIYEQVDHLIRNGHGLLLFGETGVGKTFLAKDYLSKKGKEIVKEIDLRDIKDVNILLSSILQKFGFILSTSEVDLNIFALHLKKVQNEAIILFDNADYFVDRDGVLAEGGEEVMFTDVIDRIVNAGKGRIKILATSRRQLINNRIENLIKSQKVGKLEQDLALKLLCHSKMATKPSNEMLDKAVELCKFLPLNLNLIGGMLQSFGSDIEEITKLVQDFAAEQYKQILDVSVQRDKEIEISTLSVLNANYQSLGDQIQKSAVLLTVFRRPFKLKDIQFMFEGEMDIYRLKTTLYVLKYKRILQFNEGCFDLHPKVRSFLESKKDDAHIVGFYQGGKEKFLSKYNSYFKQIAQLLQRNYHEAHDILQKDYTNFQFAFDMHITDGIPLFDNYYDLQLASSLLSTMFKKDWRADFFQKLARNAFFKDDLLNGTLFLCHSAFSRSNIDPHKALETLAEAKPLLESQEIGGGSLDGSFENKEILAVRSMFEEAKGACYYEIGKNSNELVHIEDSLKSCINCCNIREKIYGSSGQPDLARALSSQGVSQCLLGIWFDAHGKEGRNKQADIALDCYKKALKIFKTSSEYNIEVPLVLQNMAAAYQVKESYKKAYEFYKRAIKAEQQLKIDGYYTTALIFINLANVCREINKNKDALTYAKEGCSIRVDLIGQHTDTVQSLYQVAVIHDEQGMLVDAIEWYKKAFEMEERLPEIAHSSVRMNIRKYMIEAYEKAIKRKLTYLSDDMVKWKRIFSEMVKQESEVRKKQDNPSLPGTNVQLIQNLQEMSLEEINKSWIDVGMARMFMSSDGGRFEFRHLSVVLDVPQNSVFDIELQISRVSDVEYPIRMGFGESVISDMVKVGPMGSSFSKPALLSLPHCLHKLPDFYEVAIKCFDEVMKEWIPLQTRTSESSSNPSEKYAIAEISKMSVYVVCVTQISFTDVVPRNGLNVFPFGEEVGVQVKFNPGTFGSKDTQVKFKLNKFSRNAAIQLAKREIQSSPILQIEVANGDQIEMPVMIKLPLKRTWQLDGSFIALRGNNECFTDITASSLWKSDFNSVYLQVDHFSSFVVVWITNTCQTAISVAKSLFSFTAPPLEVFFRLYGRNIFHRNRTFCLSCSHAYNVKDVEEYFADSKHEFIESHRCVEALYNGAKMNVKVLGSFLSSKDKLTLQFKSGHWSCTDKFKLERNPDIAIKASDNYVVIIDDNNQEIASIPYPDLIQEISSSDSPSISLQSTKDDFEGKVYADQEPYRFLGLKLEHCGLENVRFSVYSNFAHLERIGLSPQSLEEIRVKAIGGENIAAMKLALIKITEHFVTDKLSNDWFTTLFGQIEAPKVLKEKLEKVMQFLTDNCGDMLGIPVNNYAEFINMIRKSDCFSNDEFTRRIFNKRLGFRPGDFEYIERENIGNSGDLIIEIAFKNGKCTSLLDVLRALLRTQRHFLGDYKVKAAKIQNLLDQLGNRIEEILGLKDDDW